MHNILIIFRNLLTKTFGSSKIEILLLYVLLGLFVCTGITYYRILRIPHITEEVCIKTYGGKSSYRSKKPFISTLTFDIAAVFQKNIDIHRYYGNGDRIRMNAPIESCAAVFTSGDSTMDIYPIMITDSGIFSPIKLSNEEIKSLKNLIPNISDNYLSEMNGAVSITHKIFFDPASAISKPALLKNKISFVTPTHTKDSSLWLRSKNGLIEVTPLSIHDLKTKPDTIIVFKDGQIINNTQITNNILWDSVYHINKLLQYFNFRQDRDSVVLSFLQETRLNYCEVLIGDVDKSFYSFATKNNFFTAIDITQEVRKIKISYDPGSFTQIDDICYLENNPFNSIALCFPDGHELYQIFPTPDSISHNIIIYTNISKLHEIEKNGLTVHVKYPSKNNIQIARIFILTTILSLLLTAIINLTIKIIKNKRITKLRKKTPNMPCYGTLCECIDCPVNDQCDRINKMSFNDY